MNDTMKHSTLITVRRISTMPLADIRKLIMDIGVMIGGTGISDANLGNAIAIQIQRTYGSRTDQEIRNAFELACSGHLDIELKLFGGHISINMIGQVLSAFRKYEATKLGQYTDQTEQLSKGQIERIMLDAYEKRLKDVRNRMDDETYWIMCPMAHECCYNYLNRNGQLVVTEFDDEAIEEGVKLQRMAKMVGSDIMFFNFTDRTDDDTWTRVGAVKAHCYRKAGLL